MIPSSRVIWALIFLVHLLPRDTAAFVAHQSRRGVPWSSSSAGKYSLRNIPSNDFLSLYSKRDDPSARQSIGYFRSTRLFARQPPPSQTTTTTASSSSESTKSTIISPTDIYFDPSTPINYILGQFSLIVLAVVVSLAAHTPNFGCGPTIQFSSDAIRQGLLYTIPLGLLAAMPDLLKLEDTFPALKSVTKATLRSVLSLLGGQWKPVTALIVCTLLGMAAGVGEEMLFRGLLQYELTSTWELPGYVAVLVTSVVFGALHAVTPLYAGLAGVASVYFGWMYTATSDYNLAVPIVCHAVYDIGALLYAHWTVSKMTAAEQEEVYLWEPFPSAE